MGGCLNLEEREGESRRRYTKRRGLELKMRLPKGEITEATKPNCKSQEGTIGQRPKHY